MRLLNPRGDYPALTDDVKSKILGKNDLAAIPVPADGFPGEADRIGRIKTDRGPGFATFGPKTTAEFQALQRFGGFRPG